MSHILVVDDEEILAKMICRFLVKRGFEAVYATSVPEAIRSFEANELPSVCFVDYRIGRESGLDLLARFRKVRPETNVVMITGHGDVGIAVHAMKSGASDFLIKPVPLETIARISLRARQNHNPEPSRLSSGIGQILGRSAATQTLRATLGRLLEAIHSMRSNQPSLLLTGESGTGKNLVATALHADGPRANKPYISVNCAALLADVVDAELFGYERDAFAGATTSCSGLFERANGGVLFLDEIGDLPLAAQGKLLRVIEGKAVRRLGSQETRPVDVWVIAATNRSLSDLVTEGLFRSDLLFRLQVLWINVPPLRERDADTLLLADRFISLFAQRYQFDPVSLSDRAKACLIDYQWPGNVRELRNVVERAIVLSVGSQIDIEHIVLSKESETQHPDSLEGMEVAMLRQSLSKANGNVTRAASLLGISRDTMRYRIEKFGLSIQ